MPGNPSNDQFLGRTYLYMRDHPADSGIEPLTAGLPFWVSPDITVIRPDDSRGVEAVAGQVNQVEVRVYNAGGIDANDACVDLFFANPSTAFTPATATLVGEGYLSIPGYNSASILFPWMPPTSFLGHGCFVSRVSLIVPPDTYVHSDIFDVPGDRHITQRNIAVIDAPHPGARIKYPFQIANPTSQRTEARVSVKEIFAVHERKLLHSLLGAASSEFADRRLVHRSILLPGGSEPAGPQISVVLEPGQSRQAVLLLQQFPHTSRKKLSAVHVTQSDSQGRLVGGLVALIHTP
jgi:hypothetical protein